MGVVIVYPTKEQGYNAFWNNVENDGFRTIEHIPKELILSQTNTKDNMSMTLKNGSTLTLVGLMLIQRRCVVITPSYIYCLSSWISYLGAGALSDRLWLLITVRLSSRVPRNRTVYLVARLLSYLKLPKRPTQYAQRVYATQYMSAEQLEQTRQDYINEYGNDFLFRQEFLLDEGQALMTSYYGNEISRKIKNGEIGIHPHDRNLPVYTSWDLGGGGDGTAGLFWQYYNKSSTL